MMSVMRLCGLVGMTGIFELLKNIYNSCRNFSKQLDTIDLLD